MFKLEKPSEPDVFVTYSKSCLSILLNWTSFNDHTTSYFEIKVYVDNGTNSTHNHSATNPQNNGIYSISFNVTEESTVFFFQVKSCNRLLCSSSTNTTFNMEDQECGGKVIKGYYMNENQN